MPRGCTSLLFLPVGSLLLLGCTVDFDVDDEGVFRCDTGEQCVDDQKCLPNESGTLVCKEPNPNGTCVDDDEDGYGTSESTNLRACSSCNGGDSPACTEYDDGCDTNPDRHPGRVQRCDGVDDDCDGDIGVPGEGCTPGEGCPDPNDRLEHPDSTILVCKEIDGTPQCVIRGLHSADSDCKMYPEKQRLGICRTTSADGGTSMTWTEVPEECRE